MRPLTIAIAALYVAPALAQPPASRDWSRPVVGADAPAAAEPDVSETRQDLVVRVSQTGSDDASATPLPPPCEPAAPAARTTTRPGPPAPPPCQFAPR